MAGVRGPVRAMGAALAIQWRAAPIESCATVLITLATGSSAAAGAWLMKALIDEVGRGAAARPAHAIAAAIGVAMTAGVATALLHVAGYLEVRVRRAITSATEHALFSHVSRLSGLAPFEDPAFHDRLRLAEQASREAPQHVAGLLQVSIHTAVTLSTLTGVVVTVSPIMALVFLLCAAMAIAAQVVRSRHQGAAMRRMAGSHRRRGWYRALLVDVKAAAEIRLFGLDQLLLGRMLRAHEATSRSEEAIARATGAWQAGLALLGAAATAAGGAVVVHGALAGRYRLGDIAMFLAAIAAIQGALGQFVMSLGRTGAQLALFGSYLEILAMPVPPAGGAVPPPLRDAIELDDVWFRYGPDLPWVLRGVNLRIAAGETLGLVGDNGAGKSTLVKLLCRLYEPSRGSIRWDGVDIATFDAGALRRRIAATFQDFMRYDLTAAENIGVGDVSRLGDLARIQAAAAAVGIDERLAALPRGYDTLLSRFLGPDDGPPDGPPGAGVTLSGGQWQRVAIARALVRDRAELMILDEPSSGLDADAEHRLHRALLARAGGRTLVSISHRLGALRGADRIAVLADGVVAELGDHGQLMQRGGRYARLFTLQAREYQDHRVVSSMGRALGEVA